MDPSGNPIGYIAAFIGGALVSFTPCTYPLIPVILGVIGATGSVSRLRSFILSLVYALGVAFVYSLLGIAAVLSGKLFGSISANPWVYILVGNIFVFFGLSMLEVFDLRVTVRSFAAGPDKVGAGRPRRGLLYIFILGAASGLVIGPCTTPALGAILTYAAAGQNLFYGASLLFVFGLGMCSLLIAAGSFSGMLASLPRSGKWLVYIKKACGIILILAGEYFIIKAGMLWL